MKFGKHIQKKQLDIPEYAASFVDYKALKKLIKGLQNSPVTRAELPAQNASASPQSVLQANKAPFFFRLDRELDKVNAFYTVKESESKVRLRVLMDKQKSMRSRNPVISKTSTHYITLEQGFRDFIKDLNKLQQFIEINQTAFSKILKKWDKTSKSQTKELYLSRAVEVQPCFNHDVISELSDQATTSLSDCTAWAEGEGTSFTLPEPQGLHTPRLEQDETDTDLVDALNRGDMPALDGIVRQLQTTSLGGERLTKAFLSAVSQAPEKALNLLLDTNRIDLHRQDEINDRNCLHKAALAGRRFILQAGLAAGVDPGRADAYGCIPLHYACMNGHVEILQDLVEAKPETIDKQDLDNFTALVHGIVHAQLQCVERILSYSARVNPVRESDRIPLNLACQHGSVPIVALILEQNPYIMADAEGLYPQHLVAKFGQSPQLLLMLRDYGADLDQADKLYQWTPLFHAASEGKTDCLRTLLDSGVDAMVVDEKNLSAIYYATWEGHLDCMETLSSAAKLARKSKKRSGAALVSVTPVTKAPNNEVEMIPDLSLPPPIIPTRRYGHNFLETKTTVVISFGDARNAVKLYDESKYPAARLTIAPRSSDMLPRNILLPIQEENKHVSFEIDNIDSFSVDFDLYPTYGKKVIAKGSVPAEVFRDTRSSSGQHYMSLLDPRLRCVGQMFFHFQVIRPFSGHPLDITPFATYWKATSQFESGPNALVTGSSLSGDYIRVPVQLSRDGVPIVFPDWILKHAGLEVPILGLNYQQFQRLAVELGGPLSSSELGEVLALNDLGALRERLRTSFTSLQNVLQWLPSHVHVEVHVLYPTPTEEESLRLGPTLNINEFVDSLLRVVFSHARHLREESGESMRSMVFTSYNKDLCIAMNWKQPNYPVILCNDLGADEDASSLSGETDLGTRRNAISIKEAVRIAQANNFMGLTCRAEVLDAVPALIESIKEAGLVLVSDASSSSQAGSVQQGATALSLSGVQDGIDGVFKSNGVLTFKETIDV